MSKELLFTFAVLVVLIIIAIVIFTILKSVLAVKQVKENDEIARNAFLTQLKNEKLISEQDYVAMHTGLEYTKTHEINQENDKQQKLEAYIDDEDNKSESLDNVSLSDFFK